VSHLVAQGLTNSQAAERMFLSRHTIDFHLRQIFRKLAIASRVELAASRSRASAVKGVRAPRGDDAGVGVSAPTRRRSKRA
jgi:hypothetical protein